MQVLLPALRGHPPLDTVDIWFFQEVVAPEGISFDSDKHWRLVAGKTKDDWRGTAIVFRLELGMHSCTKVCRAGLSTCIKQQRGLLMGLLNYHLPHHATIDQATEQLHELQEHRAAKLKRVVMGMDANETFRPRGHHPLATTGRGEALLQWLEKTHLRLPPQDLETPTHFPYNSALRPRRIDYVAIKGGASEGHFISQHRDLPASDHEAVVLYLVGDLRTKVENKSMPAWGPTPPQVPAGPGRGSAEHPQASRGPPRWPARRILGGYHNEALRAIPGEQRPQKAPTTRSTRRPRASQETSMEEGRAETQGGAQGMAVQPDQAGRGEIVGIVPRAQGPTQAAQKLGSQDRRRPGMENAPLGALQLDLRKGGPHPESELEQRSCTSSSPCAAKPLHGSPSVKTSYAP